MQIDLASVSYEIDVKSFNICAYMLNTEITRMAFNCKKKKKKKTRTTGHQHFDQLAATAAKWFPETSPIPINREPAFKVYIFCNDGFS